MIIVYSMTRNLYPKILPSIRSVLDHNDARIYVLAEDDSVPDLPKECEVINVSDQTFFPKDGANYKTSFTYMVLMRLAYPALFKEDRIISLDVDTIVCDSLLPIWEKEMDGKWIAAVPERLSNWRPYGGIYFNVGVCVYNLKQMREDNIAPTLINYVNTHRLTYCEQDCLNYFGLSQRKIAQIPLRYNESYATGMTLNPAVVHYAGVKDWYENRDIFRREFLDKYCPPSKKE